MKCRIKPEFVPWIAWGKADSPQRPLCALCHGALTDAIPLRVWRDNGSSAALCDECVEEVLEVLP